MSAGACCHLSRAQASEAAFHFAEGHEVAFAVGGFDSGAVVMDLRITGTEGVINIDDFLGQNQDGSADFLYRKGGWGGGTSEETNIPSTKPGAALMFEDMAAAAADPSLREQWMTATERTQALLDAVWLASSGSSPDKPSS